MSVAIETLTPDRALFVDLYLMTMLQAYLAEGRTDTAVFSVFVRRLPPTRRYLLTCGVATVVEQLERVRFTEDDLSYLGSLPGVSGACVEWLRRFRFTGSVYAVAEGTPLFAQEPILEVVAPLPEAQLVETLVMNQIHLQTLLASKGARIVRAAQGRTVLNYGSRRMHGVDAAVTGARALYIAGVAATSNLLAGKQFGIPVAGTMAHSYVQAHESEAAAFRQFTREFPHATLLVDTYDTLEGVKRVIELVRDSRDCRIAAVRLDSGDLLRLAPQVRQLLDDAGLQRIGIVASNDLDEHRIAELVEVGAPIDGFGVGTHMGVSADAPALDIVYKLVAYGGSDCTKLSPGKSVLPGRKQVFRDEGGRGPGDTIACANEQLPGRPLLHRVMCDGRRTASLETDLSTMRRRAASELSQLPADVLSVEAGSSAYPVRISPELQHRHQQVMGRIGLIANAIGGAPSTTSSRTPDPR